MTDWITVFEIAIILNIIYWLTPQIIRWIIPKISPHFKKIPFFFIFIITMFIAITISLSLLDTINIPLYSKAWPYQMTFLTLLLGYETYRMFKGRYPNPKNYTLQQSLKNHRLDEPEVKK